MKTTVEIRHPDLVAVRARCLGRRAVSAMTVVLAIGAASACAGVPYPRGAPFDLVADAHDDNGFLRNPRWAKQDAYLQGASSRRGWDLAARPDIMRDCLDHAEARDPANIATLNDGYNPFDSGYQRSGGAFCAKRSWLDNPWAGKCTMLGSEDSPDNLGGNGGFLRKWHLDGHVNLEVVTYDGVIRWDTGMSEDDWDFDWGIDLYTPDGAGVASRKEQEQWVHTEMNPQELGDNFDFGWWQALRDAIHQGQAAPGAQTAVRFFGDDRHWERTKAAQDRLVAPRVNGKRAIAIGLMNLDVGHNEAGAELHALYGLAIHAGGRTLPNTECHWQPRNLSQGELDGCDAGSEKDAQLCYPTCRAGFSGKGPVCYQRCPSGFRDDGLYCAKPEPYGRGAGYPWQVGDPLNLDNARARCQRDNPLGCEIDGAIVYPKCRAGFHATGCCVCSPDCPAGMTDIGVSCQKQSYGRGGGAVPNGPPATEWCEYDEAAYTNWHDTPSFDAPIRPADDAWMIFATDFGSQGYCSTKAAHTLGGAQSILGQPDFQQLTFRIPWAKDAAGRDMLDVEVLPSTLFKHQGTTGQYTVALEKTGSNRGVVISFPLTPSSAKPMFFGELHLKWKAEVTMRVPARPAITHAPIMSKAPHAEAHPWAKLPAATQARVAEALAGRPPPPPPAPQGAAIARMVLVPAGHRPVAPRARPSVPPPSPVTTPAVGVDDVRLHGALCEAYRGTVDGDAAYCAGPQGRRQR